MWELNKSSKNRPNKTPIEEDKQNPLCVTAHLILPWLTPLELANISLTCKTLSNISNSINLHRSLDATRSFETLPVPFHNPHHKPPYAYFLYTPSQSSRPLQRQFWGPSESNSLTPISHPDSICLVDEFGESVSGCECEDCVEVGDGVYGCPCLSGMEEEIVTECGPRCGCGSGCKNRLTGRGISVGLKIVWDVNKGWCLFADQDIQQGQFVCEYAGELLTTKEARTRQQIYDELATHGGYSSALLVIREHLPSGKACLRINMDATRIGNIARFINHSCDGGNLSTMLVRSLGSLLPRLCFFASKDIKQDEELTFSYGEVRVRSKGLPCFCETTACYGTLPSEHT